MVAVPKSISVASYLAAGLVAVGAGGYARSALALCAIVDHNIRNEVYVLNKCEFAVVARVKDKSGTVVGITKLIAPGKRQRIDRSMNIAPSDWVFVSDVCNATQTPRCKPK